MVVRKANVEDQSGWDDYVTRHPLSSPYHLFGWGLAVTNAYGHEMISLVADDGGRIRGVLPLIYMKPPFIQGELVSLPFCDLGGVLADSADIRQMLIAEALVLGRSKGVRHLELRESAPELSACDVAHSASAQFHKVRLLLELPSSSEILMSGFKSKLRSQLRKSEKNGMEFRWGRVDDLDDFYTVFSENMKALGSPVHSKDWFSAVLNQFQEKARLGMVYSDRNPAGVGLILCHRWTVTIPWASTDKRYNHMSPNMFLYWNILKYASDNGYSLFDFGRSTPGEGTYNFKEQWGARPVSLNWHYINICGKEKTAQISSSQSRLIVENLWKRLPLKMANAIGPAIRKYISL